MISPMLLEFGLGGAVLAMVLLLFIRYQKNKLRHSVLRYERIKKALED
ncbi:MAG: hypothetical protein V1887_01935 [Candidatus Aenigmatarchaeota archaeon]